jgi:hypothetical protein
MLLTRRTFLAASATLPYAFAHAAASTIPVGLELYSVREALKKDPEGTVRAVAQMGYQCVEFYSPYYDWTESQAKQMRKLLDDLGIHCYSTHNNESYLTHEAIGRTRDLNGILGCKYVICAHADPKPGPDGWKPVADELNAAAEQLEPAALHVGYHNHKAEFVATNSKRAPIRSHGSIPTRDAFARSIAKTGRPTPPRDIPCYSVKASPIGRRSLPRRNPWVEWSTTWWNRKAAGSPKSKPHANAWRRFERCIPAN